MGMSPDYAIVLRLLSTYIDGKRGSLVNVLAFYSDDPNSNLDVVYNFC